jgi:hypothetical protein
MGGRKGSGWIGSTVKRKRRPVLGCQPHIPYDDIERDFLSVGVGSPAMNIGGGRGASKNIGEGISCSEAIFPPSSTSF